MNKKGFVLIACLLILGTLLAGWWPVATYAQQDTSGENFIFVNYVGQEIVLDLDDVTYTVPGTNVNPAGGRLALTLPAGEHKFAANVPGGPRGFAGEFTLSPGQVVAKAARIDQTGPVVEDGKLLVEPQDYLFVFDFDPFATPVAEDPVVDTWQPQAAMAGMGSLVVANFIGDELTVDLNGTLYKVTPAEQNIPGRLQLDVPPGTYSYTASVPGGSLNGEATLVAGNVTALNITATPPAEPEYDVGEEFEIIRPVEMKLFEEDLTQQASAAVAEPTTPDAAPQTLPATGGQIVPAVVADPPAVSDGLLVKNYAGDTLIFTINNQRYTIPDHGAQLLNLPPGNYTFTASIPGVAQSGHVGLAAGQGVELSIAINVAHDFLHVYQN